MDSLYRYCDTIYVGCGSGRDSKYFVDKGYEVVAIDPSLEMCKRVRKSVAIPVCQICAEEISFKNEFNAVWACASLLLVKDDCLVDTLQRLIDALCSRGVLYASWKYGVGERVVDGRYYLDMSEEKLASVLISIKDAEVLDSWITHDVRKERADGKWINVLLKKK